LLLGQRTWLVSVAGELDMHSAPDLERELRAALDGGAEVVIVDLAKCDFIDSTALGVLVSTRKELEPTGGRISLIASDSNIRRVFEITGFDRMFTIHATRAASIGATTNGGAPPTVIRRFGSLHRATVRRREKARRRQQSRPDARRQRFSPRCAIRAQTFACGPAWLRRRPAGHMEEGHFTPHRT
jgi:anti-sigma B factor antagonist